MNPIRLAVALALAAAAPLAAQQGSGETIPLRFGWEPGMQAEIDFEQVRVRRMGSESDSSRLAATYRMDVSAHAGGLAIDYSGMRWTALPPPSPRTGRYHEALTRVTRGARPRTVVSRAGAFLRVEGEEQVAARTSLALEPLLAEIDASMRESARALLTAGLQPAALRHAAADEWNTMVGMWVGKELEMGEPYTMETVSRSPLFGDVTIPFNVTLRIVGRIRCTPQDAEARCVEMELRSAPDQEMMTRAHNGLLQRSGVPAEQVQATFAQLNIQSSVRLHADPRTLRLYYVQIVRNASGHPDADALRQVETKTFRFRYLP